MGLGFAERATETRVFIDFPQFGYLEFHTRIWIAPLQLGIFD